MEEYEWLLPVRGLHEAPMHAPSDLPVPPSPPAWLLKQWVARGTEAVSSRSETDQDAIDVDGLLTGRVLHKERVVARPVLPKGAPSPSPGSLQIHLAAADSDSEPALLGEVRCPAILRKCAA